MTIDLTEFELVWCVFGTMRRGIDMSRAHSVEDFLHRWPDQEVHNGVHGVHIGVNSYGDDLADAFIEVWGRDLAATRDTWRRVATNLPILSWYPA